MFTLFLGVWSIPTFLFGVPMIIFRNTIGGIDVTEFYSNSAIDPIRQHPPLPGTAVAEERFSMLMVLALLVAILIVIVYVFYIR